MPVSERLLLVFATWTHLVNGLAGLSLARRALNALLRGQAHQHLAQLDRRPAHQVQLRTLLGLVRRAARTPFGVRHDFRRICTLDDFRRLVPVRSVQELGGERREADPARLASQREVLRTALGLAARSAPRARFLSGLTLLLEDPAQPSPAAPIACLPSLVRPFARFHRGPDRHGNDDPIGALAELYAREEVSCLVGPAAAVLHLVDRVKRIRAVEQLERVWPRLTAVVCLQGTPGSVPPRLKAEVGERSQLLQVVQRPEGPIAIEDDRCRGWRLLTDHGVFFEFLQADGSRLSLDEVETGVPYELALTAPGGVWACRLGVRVALARRQPALLADLQVLAPSNPALWPADGRRRRQQVG